MAHIGLRLQEVEGWDGKTGGLPPHDDVLFVIEKATQENSAKKGTPMLKLELMVVDGELRGRKAFSQFVIAPDAKEGSRRRLKQLIMATQLQLDQQGGFDDAMLIGRQFVADVVSEPYTETDPATGQVIEKSSSRIINERPVGAPSMAAGAPAGYPSAQAPQYAPPQAAYAPPQQVPHYAPPGQYAPPPAYAQPPVGRGAPGVTPVAR